MTDPRPNSNTDEQKPDEDPYRVSSDPLLYRRPPLDDDDHRRHRPTPTQVFFVDI